MAKRAPVKPARKRAKKKADPVPIDRAVSIEVVPHKLEETLRSLADDLRHWANQGRYTKVRFKFRGKPLLPDLPLAAVAAAEGLTFYWGGILRALAVNVAGKSLLEVELVHDAEKKVVEGKEALLAGDLDVAIGKFREAVEMDRNRAPAHLSLGIALKLSGDKEGARRALRAARDLDPTGPSGTEAERLLAALAPS